jgi:FkbM family methyltransferase
MISSNIKKFIDLSKNLNCKSFFDIGSRDGDDANFISKSLNINEVYVFEPIPDSARFIEKKYPNFSIQELAISDADGYQTFYALSSRPVEERGISSLRDRSDGVYVGAAEKIVVKTNRFDTWCYQNNIKYVDLVKLDVEGCTYEALVGFGKILDNVKAIHMEVETSSYWVDQKLKHEVESLMLKDFHLALEIHCGGFQFDQVWINKKIF